MNLIAQLPIRRAVGPGLATHHKVIATWQWLLTKRSADPALGGVAHHGIADPPSGDDGDAGVVDGTTTSVDEDMP
ncbi:MAG: hypothetical protein V3S75_03530 [Euzebya tangerina]|nr:hypothetical protein [Euzebya tangerina]